MSSKRKTTNSFDERIDDVSLDHQDSFLKAENEQEQEYISYLKTAPEFVLPEDAPQFFNDILLHFDNKYMTEELGLEIFRTLRIMIHNPDFFSEFAKGDFLLQLPFYTTNPKYIHQILNVIYDVIQIDPTIINYPLGDEKHFGKIVIEEPLKSLSLIKTFAERCFNLQYNGEVTPWALIDILYYEIESFMNEIETFKKYSSVLLYILHEYQIYRDYRLESYWDLFVGCLSRVEDHVFIQIIYNILCYLFDYFNTSNQEEINSQKKKKDKKLSKSVAIVQGSKSSKPKSLELPELPINQILKHVRINTITRGAVFKLLILYAMSNPGSLFNSKLIQILMHYAKKSLNASLILMTIAEDETCADLITSNGNLWLDKGLPEAFDTLRLFVIVFQHKHLRECLISNNKFVSFLNFVTNELKSAGTISMVGYIVNKGDISQETMEKIRNEQFINTFLDVASQNDVESKVSSHNALQFIQKAAKFGIFSDFLPYIQWISKLKDDEELKETVSLVAAELARNESCAKKMVSLRFNNFYERQLNDPSCSDSLKANANAFLKRVQRFQRRE